MLERYLKKLFTIADTNGDGVLQPEEMSRLLELSGFNFDKSHVSELVAAADTNQNGVIEYDEFIPVAMDILRGRKAAGLAPMPRMQDVPAPMLERYLKKLFNIADVNGDGVLQPAEFKKLLQLSGFNFPASAVEQLMTAADVNHDGVIQYEEFIPVAMQVLLGQQDMMDTYITTEQESAARSLLMEGETQEQVLRKLKKYFLFADEDNSGFLDAREFKNILGHMGFPLTAAQISEVMKLVDVNHDNQVSYEEFLPVAFELLVKVVAGTAPTTQEVAVREPAPVAENRSVAKSGWTTYSSLYESKGPVDTPVTMVEVGDGPVATLEGRVLAVQSRRIIRSKIKDLFARLDSNKDGRLSLDELAAAFGSSAAQRLQATLDRNHDGNVTQYEMRRFFDDECRKAVESGVPEYEYLESIVTMLEA